MAINKGWDGKILVGSGEMAQINSWEISFAGDALENTAFGDTVHDRGFEPGLRSHTVTFSGYYEDSDTAQSALVDNMMSTNASAASTLVLLHNKTTGSKAGFTGSAVITGLTVGEPVDGLATFNGTAQISGGLSTYSTA